MVSGWRHALRLGAPPLPLPLSWDWMAASLPWALGPLSTTQSRGVQKAHMYFWKVGPLLRPRAEVGGGSASRGPEQPVVCPSDVVARTPREAHVWEQRLDSRPGECPPAWARRGGSGWTAHPRLLAVGTGSWGIQGVQWGGRRPSGRGRARAPRLQRPRSESCLCRGAGSSVWRSPRALQCWPTQPHSSTCV